MDEMITQLGVGGILAVLVIREVLGFLEKKENRKSAHKSDAVDFTYKDQQRLRDLHVWHAKEDEDGVKVWYGRRPLEIAVERLADNLEQQTVVLRELHSVTQDTARGVSRCEDKLNS